ncbi:MAG: 1-acyl-sn-glycerol-3-phosphate acyltransferase [Bacteroidales bacterium]|nr:1-acyl-sn-glycerol-3-phosphate acyltransferase [Bacteroidales bacterium]
MEVHGNGTIREARLGFSSCLLRAIGYLMVHLVQRPKLCGPKPALDKPTVFACRHVGMIDATILIAAYPKMVLHPLAALDYVEKNAFTRWFFTNAMCIPIDRKNHSQQWLEDSLAAMQKGESIIIYPEGTRNYEKKGLMPFKRGVAALAASSGAQIIPVYNANWSFPHRYRYAMGEPFHIDPVPPEGATHEWELAQAARIREKVLALEPLVNP